MQVWWAGLFLVVGVAAASYVLIGREAELTIARQVLKRERVIARAQSSNIVSYFERFGSSVVGLAGSSTIDRRDLSTTHDMDLFVEQRRESGLVSGIVLTDAEGIVEFNSTVTGAPDPGVSLADRDYFGWAKGEQGEGNYFIGRPVVSRLGASEGQVIVPVASPVFRNEVFTGAAVAAVRLAPLTANFFGLMKVSDKTEVLLLDKDGRMLFSSLSPDLVGTDVLKLLEGRPDADSKALSNKLKGILGASQGGEFLNGEQLVAYSPVQLKAQNWLLVIVAPDEEIAMLAEPIYLRQTAILLFVFLTFLLSGVLISRSK